MWQAHALWRENSSRYVRCTYKALPVTGGHPVVRSAGVTPSERRLVALAERSFLSLWSWPNVFRDQGPARSNWDGKEVADLLVIFEDHVLIFSDKECAFPEGDDLDLAWARWYRRAVEAAAKQLFGAERWLREHPDRLFLDRACTQAFPLVIPHDTATFHRIVVARGASGRCRHELGGSGSLMLRPEIRGAAHTWPRSQGGSPFTLGQVSPDRGYVHVFDDTTVEILLSHLDTISDFVAYLQRRRRS